MAVALVVVCTKCEKKFKPKNDVRGKKIRCPFCEQLFVVPAGKDAAPDKAKPDGVKAGKPKPDAVKAGKPKQEEIKAGPPEPTQQEAEDLDGSPDPYAVKHVELVPRCPNCTEEMGPHDIICLACGYNTLTRSWGKTEKKKGNTFGRHFIYLLPALGSAAFVVFAVFGLIFHATVDPYLLTDGAVSWLNTEAIRMWTTVFILFWVFGAGVFCFKKFIEKPQPEELELE
jgi:DNA-directed RNA polymerase subunit RPC12/RpoP